MTCNLNNLVGTLMKDVTTTKGATLVSVEDFHKDIVEGKYLAVISKILNAKATGATTTIVVKGNELTVSLDEQLKKQLPFYVPQADVRKRRMWEHARDFTGLAPIDCDHLTKEQVDSLMDWAKEQPWIVEGHRSSRGEGVHLIVAMGVVKCDTKEEYTSEYKRRYAIISRYIEQQTGIEVDWQCTDALRGIFVSYDPEAFLRPVSEVKCFDYPEETLPGDTPDCQEHQEGRHRDGWSSMPACQQALTQFVPELSHNIQTECTPLMVDKAGARLALQGHRA